MQPLQMQQLMGTPAALSHTFAPRASMRLDPSRTDAQCLHMLQMMPAASRSSAKRRPPCCSACAVRELTHRRCSLPSSLARERLQDGPTKKPFTAKSFQVPETRLKVLPRKAPRNAPRKTRLVCQLENTGAADGHDSYGRASMGNCCLRSAWRQQWQRLTA